MKKVDVYKVNSTLRLYVEEGEITFIRHGFGGDKRFTLSEEEIKKMNKLAWTDKEDKNEKNY